jgi:hypothetical protein
MELPELHEDFFKHLTSTDDVRDADAVVEDVRFLPDEDDTAQAPPDLEAVTTPQAQAARQAAAEFLSLLDREVAQ